jgi:hypothetical protein
MTTLDRIIVAVALVAALWSAVSRRRRPPAPRIAAEATS